MTEAPPHHTNRDSEQEDHLVAGDARLPTAIPRVAIIVLNWNGWKDTVECLESLQRLSYQDYLTVVVDNGSTDDSVQRIHAWARGDLPVASRFFSSGHTAKPVTCIEYDRMTAEAGGEGVEESRIDGLPSSHRLVLIRTEANLGFAAGNNVGLRYALWRGYPLMLLLNNDTVVRPDFLRELVVTLETDQRVVAVGPKILHKDRPDVIWYAGGRLRLWRLAAAHIGFNQADSSAWAGTRFTDHVTGCCFLARRELFERFGLLDEDYFFGNEDWAYCLHVRRAGLLMAVNLDAVIYHKGGGSSGVGNPLYVYYYTKNRLLILKKHGRMLEKVLGLIFFTASRAVKWTLLLLHGRTEFVAAELRAIRDFAARRYGEVDRAEANRRLDPR